MKARGCQGTSGVADGYLGRRLKPTLLRGRRRGYLGSLLMRTAVEIDGREVDGLRV